MLDCAKQHLHYVPPPLVRVSRLASSSSQGAQTQARGGGITAAPVLARGHYPASCPLSSLELSLTAMTPQNALPGWILQCKRAHLFGMFFWSAWRLKGGSNPRKVLFLFILFCVTFIALAFSPRLTIRYLFCQHTWVYKCRETQVWIVWKMKQYFPKLLKTFC